MNLYRIVSIRRGAVPAWGVERASPGSPPGIIQEFWEFSDAERALDTLRSIERSNVLREGRDDGKAGRVNAVF